MASTGPSSKLPKSNIRRSLPVPSTKALPTQKIHQVSQSTSSISRILHPSRRTSSIAGAQHFDSSSNIAKPVPFSSHAVTGSISSTEGSVSKPYAQRRKSPLTSSSIGKLSIAPRTQELCRPSTSLTATSPTTAYGFSTPAKTVSCRPAQVMEQISTPKGPRQYARAASQFNTPAQTPSKKATSPYANAHIADPCIPDCLVHQLSPCGHKIMTKKPVPCASNCRRPISQQHVSAFTNILQSPEAFVCAACVELHIQSHKDMKRTLYEERMERTEMQMGGFPDGWRQEQRNYWRKVWENDSQAERMRFEGLGRKCYYIPGEPIEDGEVEEAGTFISAPAPWPPMKRPSATRKIEGDNAG